MKTRITQTKHVFVLMVFAFLLTLPATASTALTGWISKDTTLSLAGSPYIVTNYVGISYGYTMTIQPGVEMLFDAGANLLTYGNLNAEQVTFKSSSTTPAPGSWGSIQIGASSDTSNVFLKNCDLEYGSSITIYYKGKLKLENTNMYRFSSTFIQVNNASRGVFIQGGSMTSTTGSVNSNPYGINVEDNATAVLDGVYMRYFQVAVCGGVQHAFEHQGCGNALQPTSLIVQQPGRLHRKRHQQHYRQYLQWCLCEFRKHKCSLDIAKN